MLLLHGYDKGADVLAEQTGISQAQISRIERGVVTPTTTTLAKIGEALEADLRFVERQSSA